MDIPKFDDLVEKKMLTGDKVRIDDLLNKPIAVCGFQVSTSKYKASTNGVLKHCCSYNLRKSLNMI